MKKQKSKHFRSLTVTIAVTFLTLSLLVLLLSTIFNLFFSFQAQKKIITNQQQLIAQDAANIITDFLKEKLLILDQAVNINNLVISSERRELVMNKLLGRNPSFRQLFITNTQGQTLDRVSRFSILTPNPLEKQSEPVLKSVLRGEQYISPIYIDETTSEPLILMAVPARDNFHEVQGAFVAEMNLKFMWDLVGSIKVGEQGLVYVVDRDGTLIAFADTSRVLQHEDLSSLKEVAHFKDGGLDSRTDILKGILGTQVISGFIPIHNPDWAVVVETPVFEAYSTIFQTLGYLLLVVLIGIVFAVAGGIYFSKRITREILNLNKAAQSISQGELDTKIEILSDNEIGQLGASFNSMVSTLKELYTNMEVRVEEKTAELSQKVAETEKSKSAMLNLLEDISSSEKELQYKTEDLEKFRQAVSTSFDHTIITDTDGRIIYANHAAEILTGYSQKEIIGQTPALWGGQMPKEFYETFWRTIKLEKSSYAGELTNKRKDGTLYLTNLRAAPVLDETGEIKFFVGVERDISEERKSQLKIVRHAAELERANVHIEEEKERAESILRFLKSIGEGVFATDEKRQIIFMNESAELMVGKTSEETKKGLAEDSFVFIHKGRTESKRIKFTKLALEKKKTTTFPNKTFLVQGDKEIPVSGTCSPIRDEKHRVTGTITVFQDVTKKHELDQMKDSFLSVAAHQLRTPLGGMRWSMELLLHGDLGKLPKSAAEAVEQIYENSQRMILLVNDLLNVERMDQNKGREEKKPMDIGMILEEVVKTMRREAEKRSITISLKKQKKAFPAIMVPPKHFYEAFENLLSNSIKYNKKDGSVKITLQEARDGLEITIADTGIGIPLGAQPKIFSKFFRAENAVLKETEGSGLGLSVVKSYLEEAGATVRFESQENKGTTFFITLPFRPVGS